MSFKCDYCAKNMPPRQPVNYVVTETRQKTYSNELKYGKMRGTIEESTGQEIVKQIMTCPDCYRTLTGLEPRVLVPTAVSKAPKIHQNPREEKKRWNNPRSTNRKPPFIRHDYPKAKDQKPVRPAPIVEVINPLTLVKE